jgi:hypothetical protein
MQPGEALRELNRRGSLAGDLFVSQAALRSSINHSPSPPPDLGVRFSQHDPGELHIPAPIERLKPQDVSDAPDGGSNPGVGKGLTGFTRAVRKVVAVNTLSAGGRRLSQSHGLASLRTTRRVSLVDDLRKTYDQREGQNLSAEEMSETNQFYSDQALLKRDSMRFNPAIRRALDTIFVVVDRDETGYIDRGEYIMLCCKVRK